MVSLDSLLQGAFASVIALLGAVFSAYLLIRHERQVRQQDRQFEIEQAAHNERIAAAAALATAAQHFVAEVTTPRLFVGAARVALIAEGARFSAAVATTNPKVATWAMDLVAETLRAHKSYARFALLPGSKRRRKAALAPPSHFIGWLRTWIAAGGTSDDPPR